MNNTEVERITRAVLQALADRESVSSGQTAGEYRMSVPVGVSARHIHLTRQDVETLFGPGYELTKKKDLMGGQFAANEQCTIVGLKLRAIENVRILGPVRSASQVEISATDARTLGVNAPLRESGDVAGSAPIALVGPKGVLYLKEGCIIAARHIHMTPQEARSAGVSDGDYVSVRMGSDRGAVLDHVKIRVDPSFSLEMHIDTDEANACQVRQGDMAYIIGQKGMQ
ncbi:MAG: phosphate propanoyltransferase [Butyrivibrio sp.]|nr:phosphate propanoyltransferase [Butyrivibrio sp.]